MRGNMRVRIAGNKSGAVNGYVLSPFGNIDGFGDFGGLPVITGVTDTSLTFKNDWSGSDFFNPDQTVGWWAWVIKWPALNTGGWDGPPTSAVQTRAYNNWKALTAGVNLGSTQAQAMGDQYIGAIASDVKSIDQNSALYNAFGGMPNDQAHQQRSQLFVQLKRDITTLANLKVPNVWADVGGDSSSTTGGTSGAQVAASGGSAYTQLALQQQAARSAAQAAQQAAQKASEAASNPLAALSGGSSTNLLLYGGLGLAALVGVGLLLRKRAAS